MQIKLIGAILIIVGCGGFGFRLAYNHKKQEHALRQLIRIIDFMECELQCRLTPLPELCRQAASQGSDALSRFLISLSNELEKQISPDVVHCVASALAVNMDIPSETRLQLKYLGESLGRFDLDGQIKGLASVRQSSREVVDTICTNKEVRIRTYQTLGLCVGAALAVIFI